MKVVFILVLVPMYDVSEYDVSTYQCTVLLYHPFIYQCTGVYMYVCIGLSICTNVSDRTNPILIGKEVKNKCILRAKYMY